MNEEYGNIVTYVLYNTKSFKEDPFNSRDGLVLAAISYIKFEKSDDLSTKTSFTLDELINHKDFDLVLENVNNAEQLRNMLNNLKNSPRFKDFYFYNFKAVKSLILEEQFAAITYVFPKFIYVAFRGTDSSFVGWKEDLNISYLYPVPAQKDAKKYLNEVANNIKRLKIYVGGHSKGGNLAEYASITSNSKIRNRIVSIQSFDGPGFLPIFKKEKGYHTDSHKILKVIPNFSIIGMIFETNSKKFDVVHSNKDHIYQHNPYSWNIENGDFVYHEEIEEQAQKINKGLNEWLKNNPPEKREVYARAVYRVFQESHMENTKEITGLKERIELIRSISEVSDQTRDNIKSFVKSVASTITSSFKNRNKKHKKSSKT